jgi:hypothetical protein
MMNLFRKRTPTPPPTPAPAPELPVKAGSYVTIQLAHRVVEVNGDEAVVSIRDPATREMRNVVYPVSLLKVCNGLIANGFGKRVRMAETQPAPPITEQST